ncbi:MocR-like pyridoxine biosynthesis transcription factor PdxR [Methylobacterium sp. C25]|uniref:MocR-like pyridoxine biosynthesis transcription factor PdxR n=1 Tax=Methylobacterium sp. C25 TaxID=2721622 RepID=UPI001F1A7A81|nr:PLP-dependent aminotransferase family protein [Methylobacterium sp. C25]
MSEAIGPSTADALELTLDHAAAAPLAEQIFQGIRNAIHQGRIAPDARLPSWRSLSVQLGVARGTVRSAYDRLADEELIVTAGPAGTRVARRIPTVAAPTVVISPPLLAMLPSFSEVPRPFQMGVPAQDAFPSTAWSRVNVAAARSESLAPTSYPDPRGEPSLRAEIVAHLAIARGLACSPDQVIVTQGYRAGLAVALRTIGAEGSSCWFEEPGYPIARMALEIARVSPISIPVDDEGIDVAEAVRRAPTARIALVTPGQQAPTGAVLSRVRRHELLAWARDAGAWIIEDDYLNELQLDGRPAQALAAEDPEGRVIHLGTFSKTLSPAISIGFLVAPPALAEQFGQAAACLHPSPNRSKQLALARFMHEGHFLKHLRRMKALYTERRKALLSCIGQAETGLGMGGLAVLLPLESGLDDVGIAGDCWRHGLAPAPLTPWYLTGGAKPGLLLGITNLRAATVAAHWGQLSNIIAARRANETN